MDYVIAFRELSRLGYLEHLPAEHQEQISEKPDSWLGSDDAIAKWYPAYAAEMGIG